MFPITGEKRKARGNMTKKNKFYKEGIRFECQGEGKCCVTRGRYGYVYLSFNDRTACCPLRPRLPSSPRTDRKRDGSRQLKTRSRIAHEGQPLCGVRRLSVAMLHLALLAGEHE
jgi:hypothetical protein